MKKWVKIALIVLAVAVTIAIVVTGIWIFSLDHTLSGLG
jgi:flagellar basal body-associated protein FliL